MWSKSLAGYKNWQTVPIIENGLAQSYHIAKISLAYIHIQSIPTMTEEQTNNTTTFQADEAGVR